MVGITSLTTMEQVTNEFRARGMVDERVNGLEEG